MRVLTRAEEYVLLANAVAWPFAFFMKGEWLGNFEYRISLDIGIFLVSSLLSLAVALLTVSWRSLKTARARPVASLRYE